jgi:hypothetical protein
MSFSRSLALAILVGNLAVPAAEARSLGQAFARSAISKLLKRDLTRDAATVAKPLARPRQVWRYTTRQRAAVDARSGLAPRSHMTARVTRGRPPSPETAQRRYGLLNGPEVRETWRLPAGTPARSTKALGGAPGMGEITSTKRLPPEGLVRITPLKSSMK